MLGDGIGEDDGTTVIFRKDSVFKGHANKPKIPVFEQMETVVP